MSRTAVIRGYAVAMAAVLAFISSQAFTTPLPSRKPDVQSTVFAQVPQARPGPPPTAASVAEGQALAYLRIPRFGKDWVWAVVEGVSEEALAQGPGHFPETALPGEEGNAAIAAHRAGHGDPFIDFDLLEKGDEVIVAQNGASWTYTLTMDPKIIEASDDWILDDVQGKVLTLTTCWPKYGTEKRMYVRAKLVSSS